MPASINRKATVKAATNLIVLSLDRKTFVDILGPLQDIMNKEKSAEVKQSSVSCGIYRQRVFGQSPFESVFSCWVVKPYVSLSNP